MQYPLNLLVPITLVLAGYLFQRCIDPRQTVLQTIQGSSRLYSVFVKQVYRILRLYHFRLEKKMLYLPKSFVSHRRIAIQGRTD